MSNQTATTKGHGLNGENASRLPCNDLLSAISEDMERQYWYAHGTTPLGRSDFWRPVKLSDDGRVVGETGNFQKQLTIEADEYLAMRERPLMKVGMWDFRPPTDPITELRFANRNPSSAGYRLASLKDENERLRALLRNVIAGDMCVTDLQEALGDV